MLDQGFIRGFSKKNISEDIAVVAENIYTNPQQTSEWGVQYPAIGKKVELLNQFYSKIGANRPSVLK